MIHVKRDWLEFGVTMSAMKSRKLKPRKLKPRAPLVYTAKALPKRERNRRLAGLGLSRHDPDEIQERGLAIVASYLDWLRHRLCCVTLVASGNIVTWDGEQYVARIEAAHVKSRGSFGADIGNTLPALDLVHAASHRDPEFWSNRGITPETLAVRYAVEWLSEHLDDAQWLWENASDGDLLAILKTHQQIGGDDA